MSKHLGFCFAALLGTFFATTLALAQQAPPVRFGFDPPPTPTNPANWSTLPTDRNLRVDAGLPATVPAIPPAPVGPPIDLKQLMRPRGELTAEWEPKVDGISLGSYDASVVIPTYPVFGPPPPMISGGYSFTQLDAPAMLDLPSSLHEFSLGANWMRPLNEQWMLRLMISGAFASDLENTSSDAWQLRGGVFGMYRPNQHWSFLVGALATGRDDLPVFPAIGAIWEPSPVWKVNLMMPHPRVSRLLVDLGDRQHWGYIGGGISGGTWAYQRAAGSRERLTYRLWRIVLGWESIPPQPLGTFRPKGTRLHAEVGYVVGRRFEFATNAPDISIGNTLFLRSGISF